ncbi:MAG: DUF3800 domain-containing protein [Planctomycetes bacterium]|nr:DUF3800 domain-containing protein [Planctomycetota bacterium]
MDNNQDPVYLRVLRQEFKRLRTAEGKGMVEKVRAGRSRSSSLLQLADMVSGAVVRAHLGDDQYLKLVRKRMGKIIWLPKSQGDPSIGSPFV